jgi:protein TonB
MDYPRGAKRAGIEGSVAVRFTVRTDGSVSDCEVIRSSANEELDATTCRLIERRFRYQPARDTDGRPVAEVVTRTFDWMLPRRF